MATLERADGPVPNPMFGSPDASDKKKRVLVDDVPFKTAVIELSTDATMEDAMRTLTDNKILSAPVFEVAAADATVKAAADAGSAGAAAAEGKQADTDAGAGAAASTAAGSGAIADTVPGSSADSKRKYVGLVTMADFVKAYIDVAPTASASTDTAAAMSSLSDLLKSLRLGPGNFVDLGGLYKFEPVVLGTPLIVAVRKLTREEDPVHRVPVVDPKSGRVVKVISQSHLVTILSRHKASLGDFLGNKLSTTGMGSRGVVTVSLDDTVLDAFKLMIERRISGVGVVDPEASDGSSHADPSGAHGAGALVSALSFSDMHAMALPESYSLMLGSVRAFLDASKAKVGRIRPGYAFRAVAAVTGHSTVADVLDMFVTQRVHRVFLKDASTGVPTGIVTLTDLLRYLHVTE